MAKAARDNKTGEMFPKAPLHRRAKPARPAPVTSSDLSEKRATSEAPLPKTASLPPEKKSEGQILTGIERDEPELPAGADWRMKR